MTFRDSEGSVLARPYVGSMGWDPWEELEQRTEIDLLWYRLPHAYGVWLDEHSTIVLDPDQSGRSLRTTLAEELGHAALGHVRTTEREWVRQERRAKKWAAVRLVTLEDLAGAIRRSASWDEVCDDLQVDPDLLQIRIEALTDSERAQLERLVGAREVGF